MTEDNIQKYIKQLRDEANKDMKTHVSALNELHMENLKGIREGNLITQKQIKEMRGDIKYMQNDIKDIKSTLHSHTEMIGEIKEDIEIIKEDLSKKVDYTEFKALKQKFT